MSKPAAPWLPGQKIRNWAGEESRLEDQIKLLLGSARLAQAGAGGNKSLIPALGELESAYKEISPLTPLAQDRYQSLYELVQRLTAQSKSPPLKTGGGIYGF